MHSIKSFSAHQINAVRNLQGSVWQDEYFDRIVRDQEELEEKWNYVRDNPVKAGLVAIAEKYDFLVENSALWADDGRDAHPTIQSRDAHPTKDTNQPPTPGLTFTPALRQNLSDLARKPPRLVHLKTTVVGAPDPGVERYD